MADKNEDVDDETIGSIKDNPFLNKTNKKPEDAKRQRKCRESTRHSNPIQNRIKMLQTLQKEAKGIDEETATTRKSVPNLGGGGGKLSIPSIMVSLCNQEQEEKDEKKEQEEVAEERKPRKLRMSRRNFMQQRNDDNPQRKVRASTRHNVPVAQRMRVLKEELKKDETRAANSKLAPGFRRKTFRNIKRIEERKAGLREMRAARETELDELREERLDEVMDEITRKPIRLTGESESDHKRRCDEAIVDNVKLMNEKQEFRKIEEEEEEEEEEYEDEEEDGDLYEDDSDEEYEDDCSDEDDEEAVYDEDEAVAGIEERLQSGNLLGSRVDEKEGEEICQETATDAEREHAE